MIQFRREIYQLLRNNKDTFVDISTVNGLPEIRCIKAIVVRVINVTRNKGDDK